MLKTLKRIVQDVTKATTLSDSLRLLVKRVRAAVNADAVSVFLVNSENSHYVLVATDGLNQAAQGKVSVPINMGLIGLVGKREEPISIEDAQTHPSFYHNNLLMEESLKAFLGVPIIQHRKLYGVITVQQAEARYFDDAEEAFLITLSAQLGGVIAHGEATGELMHLTSSGAPPLGARREEKTILTGIAGAPGVGIGVGVVIYPPADIDAVPMHTVEDIAQEQHLFLEALDASREEMLRLGVRMKRIAGEEEQALFEVYARILERSSLGEEVLEAIRSTCLNAQAALALVIKKHTAHFDAMEDVYLRERASDFRDLGRRVLAALQRSQHQNTHYPKRTILVGEDIPASALAEVPEGQLMGIVSLRGSHNAHVAILAKALGIPAVMGVRGLYLDSVASRVLILDGFMGHVYLSPSKNLLAEFKRLAQEEDTLNQSLISLRDKPAETRDNYRVSLQVNTGLAQDAVLSMSVGAEGVGLYRTEIPFMSRDRFPSEDEQFVIYRQILKAFAPRTVTMRTLDIGGDKKLAYFPVEEENPYLGWRGIRVTLDHPDVFLIQVRAMLRASESLNNLKIMLPMVTALSEVEDAKALIEQAWHELQEEGLQIVKPDFGVMIEVPAAAFLTREIARRADFISVGSNDLAQYMLAVDRNNARVAGLYDTLHPGMLRTLLKIVEGGHAAGKEVSICGEMASDPAAVILLLAMGFDVLSMNSTSLPRTKWLIRHVTLAQARKILDDVLQMEHTSHIRCHMQQILKQEGLGGLIRAGSS